MTNRYDTTNGVLELHIGGQTRQLVFRRPQMYVLAKRLGNTGPMEFIADGGAEDVFLVEAIVAGLSKDVDAKKEKVNPMRVMGWLDVLAEEDDDYDEDELKEGILYAIAMGKPKKQAEAMVMLLDEMFDSTSEVKGDGPFPAASPASTSGSSSLSKRHPSASGPGS